ncbi:MAG: T9SS type A sorting domain-containing protein, partial [Chitinophagaceae bacterium]
HHISYCEYWELFPTTGSTTTTVTMYRNVHSNCNPVSYIDDFSSVRVARSNGTAWTQVGNTLDSLDANNGYVIAGDAGITISLQEKYFTLGNITTAKDPLPVMFDNVKAYEKNSGVNIEWSNLTERDIAVYFVERSANGMDFTIIGQYFPKNNRDDKAGYTHFDASPMPGENFYRIKVIVKSTKIIFSKVMKIETVVPHEKISLFPNPVINRQFNVGLAGIREGGYNLCVINIKGQEIYQCKISNTGAFTVQMVKLPSSVTPGIYNLVITGRDYQENKMFIVQ